MKYNKVNMKKRVDCVYHQAPHCIQVSQPLYCCLYIMQCEGNKQATSNVSTFYDNIAYTKRPILSF